MKTYAPHGRFPRRHRRLQWYAQELCLRMLKRNLITQADIDSFWQEIKVREGALKFRWQKQYLRIAAQEEIDELLSHYRYDTEGGVYVRQDS